jgi:ABC-type uncharacterized transport system substrate-binding protein
VTVTLKAPPVTKTAPVTKKDPATRKEPPAATTAAIEPVTVILSDAGDDFVALANLLRQRLGPETAVLTLKETTRGGLHLPAKGTGPLVAVGLEAAIALIPQLASREVIFALVFNHGDHRLLQRGMIGVSMLPPPAQVLKALKELSPDTRRIAMAAGPNVGHYAATARAEATRLGLTLSFDEVRSDMELLLFVRKLAPSTQAFWLLPDNRVLSRERLQHLMAANLKSSRRTVVFSPSLFKLGGLLSAEYDLQAIARTVAEVAEKSPEERRKMKGTMRQPAAGSLAVNAAIAETLGLKVPPSLKQLAVEVGQ